MREMKKQTVDVFLDFPVKGENGRIDRIYPSTNFAKLLSQIRICEPGYLKMVGVIMVVEALITRSKESGLGVAPDMKDPLIKKKVHNATGEMAQFDDRLKQFRRDRDLIVHSFFDRNTDDVSDEITERSQSLMNDLLVHFYEARPSPDIPGAICFRFPETWTLETNPPGHGRNSNNSGC